MEGQTAILLTLWCVLCVTTGVLASPVGIRSHYGNRGKRMAEKMEDIPEDIADGLFPRYGKRNDDINTHIDDVVNHKEEFEMGNRLEEATRMFLKRLGTKERRDFITALHMMMNDEENELEKRQVWSGRPDAWNKRQRLTKTQALQGPFLEAQRRMGPEFNPTGW